MNIYDEIDIRDAHNAGFWAGVASASAIILIALGCIGLYIKT